jgi:hypothetical protein
MNSDIIRLRDDSSAKDRGSDRVASAPVEALQA